MRLFKKAPPPGWKPERSAVEVAMEHLNARIASASASYAALTADAVNKRLQESALAIGRPTSSRLATAVGTDSTPWTAHPIDPSPFDEPSYEDLG